MREINEGYPWKLIFNKNGDFRWPMILLLGAIGLAIGIAASEIFYGDWRCAFAECRIVK